MCLFFLPLCFLDLWFGVYHIYLEKFLVIIFHIFPLSYLSFPFGTPTTCGYTVRYWATALVFLGFFLLFLSLYVSVLIISFDLFSSPPLVTCVDSTYKLIKDIFLLCYCGFDF